MQSKYAELPDFKRVSCFNFDKCLADAKLTDENEDFSLSDIS